MIDETKPNLQPENNQENLENRTRIDWTEFKQKIDHFLKESIVTTAIFLTLITLSAPQLLANSQEFDATLCSLRSVILEEAEQTTISCVNAAGEETTINLDFLIKQYDVSTYSEDHINNPPFLTSEFANDIDNPNFNCHSRTLQFIQEASGVNFGASRERWLETGLDNFLIQFGDEVTRLDNIPNSFDENVIDISQVQPGDAVLFFDNTQTLIHSATVLGPATTEDGVEYLQIANKLGEAGELNSSTDDMVRLYDIWGEYDELSRSGGGSIVVYRPNLELIQAAFPT